MRKSAWYQKFFKPVYEGDGGGAAGGAAGAAAPAANPPAGGAGDPPPGGGGGDKTFTQEQVNSMVAAEKRKLQEKNVSLMSEIEALQTKSKLTSEEKSQLENKVDELRKANMTAEQLKQEDEQKLRKTFESRIEELTADSEKWKTNFTTSTIQRSIVDAAAKHEAFVPTQIVAILKDKTRLVETVDDDGKPLGAYTPKVTFEDTKDGKPVTLELTVEDAVKRMSEMDDYLNLFRNKGSGGIGGSNKGGAGGKGAKMTHAEAAVHFKDDPAGYQKWRKDNPL